MDGVTSAIFVAIITSGSFVASVFGVASLYGGIVAQGQFFSSFGRIASLIEGFVATGVFSASLQSLFNFVQFLSSTFSAVTTINLYRTLTESVTAFSVSIVSQSRMAYLRAVINVSSFVSVSFSPVKKLFYAIATLGNKRKSAGIVAKRRVTKIIASIRKEKV
jgi:hypothetical protein